jgi:MSHA biogenesis protein MshQ
MHKKIFSKKTIVIGIIALFIGLIILPGISSISSQIKLENESTMINSFNPFKEGWKYRKKITINYNMVDERLTNFPVLVSTVDTDLSNKAQFDGDDILFMDGKYLANQLFHEIEFYNGDSGELIAWVNIPSVSSKIGTNFYMYYGNPNANSQQNSLGVWNIDYVMVHHMNDNPDNMHISDSTINNLDGYKKGADEPIEQSGIVGYGQKFDGINDHIYVNHDLRLDATLEDRTYEVWITVPENIETGEGSGRFIFSKQPPGGREPRTTLAVNKKEGVAVFIIEGAINGDTTSIRGKTDVRGGSYYVVGIRDRTSDELRLYVNGVEDNNSVIDGDQNGANYGKLCIGDQPSVLANGRVFKDLIDELRVSTIVRNDAWIKTTYNTISKPSSFLSFGAEETRQRSYNLALFQRFFINHPNILQILRYLLGLH